MNCMGVGGSGRGVLTNLFVSWYRRNENGTACGYLQTRRFTDKLYVTRAWCAFIEGLCEIETPIFDIAFLNSPCLVRYC
jgi:hypothetical protein